MSLSLTKRIPNGAPLTVAQHDANLTAIEGAVNANITDIATINTSLSTTVATNSQFEGLSGGKQTVKWDNVTNKPASLTAKYPFRAGKSAADQLVAGNSSAIITYDAEEFDPNNVFDTTTSQFTAPLHGYYNLVYSTQVELDSGAPTAISIIVTLRINGVGYDTVTIDLADNTGTRIYKSAVLLELNANDVVDYNIDISQTGVGDWKVSANPSSSYVSGFLVQEA
jgi:hypothetical protein